MSGISLAIRYDNAVPVSAVVPCYRCVKTIGRAVASAAAQTRPPQELILVDDASGDDTLEALRALQQQYGVTWIRIVALPQNVGPAAARNAGWNAAGGDLIAFLDADDAWHPRKLEIQHRFMSEHPELAVSGHSHWRVDAPLENHAAVAEVKHKPVSFRALLLRNRFITPAAMIRRDVPQRFCEKMRHMEDYLLWLQICASGRRLAYLDCPLAYIFKAPFGESGLSAELVSMEKGELSAYWQLHRQGHLSWLSAAAFSGYSALKFLRRIAMTWMRKDRSAPELL